MWAIILFCILSYLILSYILVIQILQFSFLHLHVIFKLPSPFALFSLLLIHVTRISYSIIRYFSSVTPFTPLLPPFSLSLHSSLPFLPSLHSFPISLHYIPFLSLSSFLPPLPLLPPFPSLPLSHNPFSSSLPSTIPFSIFPSLSSLTFDSVFR